MALFDSDRCPWSQVEAAFAPVSALNGFCNGSHKPGNGVKNNNVDDVCTGVIKAASGPSKFNGSVPLPISVKPRSCILGIGTAVPERVFPMSEFARNILQGYGVDTPEIREFSARICKRSGIVKKHMAHGREMYCGDPNMHTYGAPSLDKRLSLFAPEALKLGTLAAERAITDWGGAKSKITHVITYSTSGMTSPALDMQLIKGLGLSQTVKHFWVSLMGCHAGLIGIRTAAEIAQADAAFRVLVVCVEINSAQAQPLDPAHLLDLNNHVVSIIFGDGAAGVVVGAMQVHEHERETPIFEVDHCYTSYIPNTDHHITARLSQSGLIATLNKNVPAVVGQNSRKFVAQLLQGTELKSESVNWAVHPGGKAVVDAVEKGCGLTPEQLRWTRYVLENYANMSSPTILFVLDKMREDAPTLPPGSIQPWTVVLGFGPGMTMEGILLKNC